MAELKPVSVGAEEMSWADAGNEELDGGDEARELLESSSPRVRIHRRNSISLPAGLNAMDSPDLQLTPDSSQQGDLSDSSFTDVDDDGEGDADGDEGVASEEEQLSAGNVPARNQRRKSIMPPPPMLKINDIDYLEVPETSPGNSITSINSIASLLKEKLALSLPAVIRRRQKEQPKDYKLHLFVGFLFICIVSLVGFSYIYYHQQVLQRAYFDRIRFNNKERIVKVFNNYGREIIFGFLGTGLSQDPVFRCLPKHEFHDDSVCMEWMHRARLYMRYKELDGSRCYRITWESLSEGLFPTDCYDWSAEHGHWYGGGQTQGMKWPVEQGQVKMAPFVTGDTRHHQWGNVLRRYFVNSNGVIIIVDPNTPLYVSVNVGSANKLCLQAKYDNFAFVNRHRPLPQLNYSICTSNNMTSLHSYLFGKTSYNLTEEEREAINTIMTEPVWHITPSTSEELTESLIANYTNDVIDLGFFRQGHVLINEYWQSNVGDFLIDPTRFPTMESTINVMQRRGFRIIFTVQPFVSTESVNFREAVKKRLLASQRATENIPTLTRYKSVQSAGMLDITSTRAVTWLQEKLQSLVEKYKVDAFYIDMGSAYDMPHYYKFEKQLHNPDEYKTIFTERIVQQVNVVGVSGAITQPKGSVFVSLPPYSSSWESLKAIIPTVLTYGIIGYPLVMPGPVGGDFLLTQLQESDNMTDAQAIFPLPDKELYMRWMQLATFLPVMSFKYLPSKYDDEKIVEMAKFLTNLRVKTINSIVKKYIEEDGELDKGFPLIKPLWMLDHADPACHTVVDEFLVGDELIVAPILENGARQREVYLPAGVWKDGIDGSLRKGSRWLHNHRVPEDKIAYFIKMPDNTRF